MLLVIAAMVALASAMLEGKEIKGILLKKKNQIPMILDSMIIYLENRKESLKHITRLPAEFGKVAGYYTRSVYKSNCSSVISSKLDFEIKEIKQFTIAKIME